MVRDRERARKGPRAARVWGLGLAFFAAAGSTPGWAQQPPTAPAVAPAATANDNRTPTTAPEAHKAAPNDYVVSPEDLLDVYVMDVPEVSRAYRVSSNGLLTLPLLPEPIPVAGENLQQLSHQIATRFHDAGMLNNANVTVSLVETRLNTVMMTGEVKSPQTYPVFGPTHLLDMLVKAGGLTDMAGDAAIVRRGEIGMRADREEVAKPDADPYTPREQTFTVKIRKLVETGDDSTNILLYPGDHVTVRRAELIYILGAVMRPGGYVLNESRQQITVMKAIAMAGDVNNVAKKSHITILRHEPGAGPEKRSEIPVDYKGMVKGEVADMRLQPDDILYVPESGGVKAMRATMNAAVTIGTYAGTSLLIYH